MKKPLLLLGALCAAAASSLAAPAEQLYMIGETTEYGWTPSQGVALEGKDGVFTVNITTETEKTLGFVSELTGNWDTLSNYRYGAQWNGKVAVRGANEMKTPSGDAFRLVPGSYTLTIDTNNNTLTVDGYYTRVWMVGNLAPLPWNPTSGIELTSTDGVFKNSFNEENSGSFCFTLSLSDDKNNWNAMNDYRFGASIGGAAIVEGTEMAVVYYNEGSYNYAGGKEYKFTLDTNNMTLEFEGEWQCPVSNLYILGAHNGWGEQATSEAHEFTKDADAEHIHTLNISSLPAGTEFKLAQRDWTKSYSTGRTDMAVGQEYPLYDNSGNMSFASALQNVRLTADLKNMTLKAQDLPTLVEETVATGAVEYFDLQGRRVLNPGKGLYIVRQGSKVTKQLLK